MADEGKRPVCAVVGVGPGNGEDVRQAFRRGWIFRGADGAAHFLSFPAKLTAELHHARAYACDVTEAASVEAAFAAMRADLGDVDALIYNAGSGVWGHVEEVKAEDLERSWRVNTLGLFLSGQQAIPTARRKGARARSSWSARPPRGGARPARPPSLKARWRSARSPNPWRVIFGRPEFTSR